MQKIGVIIICMIYFTSCASMHNIRIYKPLDINMPEDSYEERIDKYERNKLSYGDQKQFPLSLNSCFIQGNFEAIKDLDIKYPLLYDENWINNTMPESYLFINDLLIVDDLAYHSYKKGVILENVKKSIFTLCIIASIVFVDTAVVYGFANGASIYGMNINPDRSNVVHDEPYKSICIASAGVVLSSFIFSSIMSIFVKKNYKKASDEYNHYIRRYYNLTSE